MLVYEGVKSGFINDVDLGIIADKIRNKYIEVVKRRPSAPEFDSWKNSMQYMRGVLNDNEIPNSTGIAIEYNIPPTGCRIDFMMSGYKNNKSNVVIIELKQWDKCTEVGEMDGIYKVNTYTGGALRDVNHPSYQAMTYANLIRDYNENVQLKDITVAPCAYLHNYYFEEDDTLLSDTYKEYTDAAPIFGHSDVLKLRDFIKKYIQDGDDGNILYEIDNGRIRPSKMLQDSLVQMLKGNQEFYMIDSQKIVYEYALKYAIDTVGQNSKNVFIVRGGPGTGKSVLAINLLVELNRRGMTCFYVTKNAAPRTVYSSKLQGDFKKTYINHLFQGSGSFIDEETNKLDCLVVDEAHRLNAKSGMMHNKGENQVKEIINAAKFSVFFIDENQKVTLQDIGSEELIRKFANEQGAGIYTFDLDSQFRCNGSDGYVAWLDHMLEIRETANFDIDGFDYDFKVFDDPNDMRKAIEEKNSINNKSRIVAGYCWEWPTGNTRKDTNFHEIKIPEYNFEISWNLDSGEAFAIGENSINEAGCIHTVQGLEFDYVGVIIGDDLRYADEHIITDYSKRATTDNSLFGIKKIAKEQGQEVADKIADNIIKNTYRTLMTRGMKGCYVYCTDKGLQEYIKKVME
ncbi:MAG: DUF2075 domain-containing protein [Bacilli bacterium]|nr:DUF2075 domain-containing protein [Bacilli bacterium]